MLELRATKFDARDDPGAPWCLNDFGAHQFRCVPVLDNAYSVTMLHLVHDE